MSLYRKEEGNRDMIVVFVLNVLSTGYMTGLIWFVQLVHYPLHGQVGEPEFQEYQAMHMKRTSWVVIPPMLTELLTAILMWYNPPLGISQSVSLGLLICLALIWLSTALIQAPTHGLLLDRFSAKKHRQLVVTNWIRTVLWTVRAVILMALLIEMLSKILVK